LGGQEFENKFNVVCDGAKVAGSNLLVPATAGIKVVYTWPMDHAHTHAH
jgi:hypothetical protein